MHATGDPKYITIHVNIEVIPRNKNIIGAVK